jgi:transcriptional regulator with XRE-family HTH domain
VWEVVLVPVRHKPGSKPYRDELRATLGGLGAHGQRLIDLVARDMLQHGARPRQAWRYAAELSQREAADGFNQVTGKPNAPMTGNRIGDYEQWPHGGVRPTVSALKVLAAVYGTTWDQLVDARDLEHMPESDRFEYFEISSVPVTRPVPALPATVPPTALVPPSRRLGREELIAVVAAESQEFGEWAGASEVADATIGQYRDQARKLARVFEYEASVPLLLETRRLRDRVTSWLRGHARLDQARDLYLLAAQVCGLLAWETGDLGNYRAADTHAWTAWMCAEQAGHDGARTWVRATQAKLAYWDGRFTESAQLAEDGLRYPASDSARVFLALFMARALARTGRREDASSALAVADTERGRVSEPDLLGGVWELTPGRYHGLAAGVQLLLDDADRAVAEAEEAVTLGSAAPAAERHLYAELLVRTDQAVAHLQQPDLDGATIALRPVLDLPPDMRTEPLLQQLHQVRRTLALPPFASAAPAVSLQDEIETYDHEALPRQIAG